MNTTIIHLDAMPTHAAQVILFKKLYDHVWNLEPQIAVANSFADFLGELRDVIAEGEETFLSEGSYRPMFDAIVEAQLGKCETTTVSYRLLTLCGEIGDVCFESCDRVLPLGTALVLLMLAEDKSARSVVWQADDVEDSLLVTIRGTRTFGLTGRVRLGAKFLAEDMAYPTSPYPHAFVPRLYGAVDAFVRCAPRYVQEAEIMTGS